LQVERVTTREMRGSRARACARVLGPVEHGLALVDGEQVLHPLLDLSVHPLGVTPPLFVHADSSLLRTRSQENKSQPYFEVGGTNAAWILDNESWSYQSGTMKRTARKTKASPPATAAPRTAARVRADKLSVSLGVEDVRWVTRQAKRLGTSVSAVIASALADQRRAEARDTLLASLGDEDITDADVLAARREAFGR
jgi:hypothetical protein